jgi:hypothetical protein
VFSFSSKEDSVSSLEVKIKASFLTTKQAFNLKKTKQFHLYQYFDKGDNSPQHCVKKRDNSIQYCDKGDNYLETTLLLILDSCHYEVRMIGLVFLIEMYNIKLYLRYY